MSVERENVCCIHNRSLAGSLQPWSVFHPRALTKSSFDIYQILMQINHNSFFRFLLGMELPFRSCKCPNNYHRISQNSMKTLSSTICVQRTKHKHWSYYYLMNNDLQPDNSRFQFRPPAPPPGGVNLKSVRNILIYPLEILCNILRIE